MSDGGLKFSSYSQGVLTSSSLPEDHEPEIISLRPTSLAEYIGQPDTIEAIEIAIKAAQMRKEPLDHVLFHGPPGLGKTTLAHIIANEMGGKLVVTSGPALEKGGDLIGLLTHLEAGDVFFIDEIHRLPKTVEELLYPAMEDFSIDFIFDKGLHARSHRFRLKKFIMIGATTRVGLLSSPLRHRFGIFKNLDFYSIKDLEKIIRRSATILNLSLDSQGAAELSTRSRGTPRIANRLLKRVRDYAQVKCGGVISRKAVIDALALEGVDALGLTDLDRSYLRTIITYYKGGPVGIEAVAATLQEETDTLVDVVEPYLLKIGLIMRTSSGRKASAEAFSHLGIEPVSVS
ncbi:MAG: Holliday junction branch migration DNA helicase RuvB [Deltaproteobacteria bacterium]|nr:Holliday junction branch migration DNA helicase RuvB [Deltaproteobacteria bacterium]